MTYFITTKTSAHVDGSKYRLIGVSDKRDTARLIAANHNGTVRTQAELDKLIEADRFDLTTLPGYVAPEPITIVTTTEPLAASLVDIAKEIKAAHHDRRTLGAKVKVAKRVPTTDVVLEAATTFARQQIAAGVVRVALVRSLATWAAHDGTRLQRKDMFLVLRDAGAVVADATIATQFQVARTAAR